MKILYAIVPLALSSCASVNNNFTYNKSIGPGMSGDAQDRYYNTKYNMMDSSDGSQDPTANIKLWGVKY